MHFFLQWVFSIVNKNVLYLSAYLLFVGIFKKKNVEMNLPLEISTNMAQKNNQKPYKNWIASRCFTLLNHFEVILRGSSSEYKIAVLCIRKISFLKLNQSPDYNVKQYSKCFGYVWGRILPLVYIHPVLLTLPICLLSSKRSDFVTSQMLTAWHFCFGDAQL